MYRFYFVPTCVFSSPSLAKHADAVRSEYLPMDLFYSSHVVVAHRSIFLICCVVKLAFEMKPIQCVSFSSA